jgi:hypothetical protein
VLALLIARICSVGGWLAGCVAGSPSSARAAYDDETDAVADLNRSWFGTPVVVQKVVTHGWATPVVVDLSGSGRHTADLLSDPAGSMPCWRARTLACVPRWIPSPPGHDALPCRRQAHHDDAPSRAPDAPDDAVRATEPRNGSSRTRDPGTNGPMVC